MANKFVLSAIIAFALLTIGTCCGIGKYIPATCTGGSTTENPPTTNTVWQMDIDLASAQVTWFDTNYPWNKVLRSTLSDFSKMYHVVMVTGGGYFDLNIDSGFLKNKYNPSAFTFPSSTRVTAVYANPNRIIGEKITETSVTSYRLKFKNYLTSMCFGLIEIDDIDSVTLEGGDYTTHWGPCADQSIGSKWPSGLINWVCSCANCATECSKCSGPTQNECSACSSGYYLQPSSTFCQISCPPGYWEDDTNRICTACHSACSACSGPNSNQCFTCNPGYFLQGTTCAACHLACSVCTEALNTQCSACNTNYHLQPSPDTTTCLGSCPEFGYWPDPATKTCKVCHSSCSKCSGPNNNECSACKSGYFLLGATCTLCHSFCSECTGSLASQCSACKTNYYLQPPPLNTMCQGSCPDGHWPDDASNQCQPCHASCSKCTGPENTVCTACNSGFFLQPSSTICSDLCPTGYFGDTSSNTCVQCDVSCSDCSGPGNNLCSACNSDYFLQPAPSDTTCLNSCPPTGYWKDTANHVCSPCNIACSVCTDANNDQCSECNSGYFLQPVPDSTTCLDSCPVGYWGDTTTNTCMECDIACSNCTGPANTKCSACNTRYFLQQSSTTCLNSCPDGSWPNSTSNSCENCDISCSICSSSDNTQCSACSSGYYLQPSSTICLSSCPPIYYYPNTTLNTCESCPVNCPNCTGLTCDKLDSETLSTIETVAAVVSAAAQATTIATIVIPVIVVTAGSTVALFLDFLGEIAIFQFINVPFPENFEVFMQFFSANIFPNFLAKTYDESESIMSTNGKFEEYECSRVFLDNCGGELDKEILAITVIIVTSLSALIFQSCPKAHSIICKIRDSYRWNGLLAFYIGDFQEFLVFTLVQFRESVRPLISLIVGILLVASYFVMYLYISVALNRRKKAATKKPRDSKRPSRSHSRRRKTPEQEEEIGDIPESMNMVVDEFVRKNWYSRNFLLIMCLQSAIISFILVFLQNWGTYQAGIYSYMAIFYGIIVLGAFRPFKDKVQVIAFSISQFAKGGLGCLALVLGLDDQLTLFSDDQRNAIGIALITVASVGICSNLLVCVGMIGKAAIDFWRNFRKKRKDKKDTLLKSRSKETKNSNSALLESKAIRTTHRELREPHNNRISNNNTSFITGSEDSVGMNKLNPHKDSTGNLIVRSRQSPFIPIPSSLLIIINTEYDWEVPNIWNSTFMQE